MDEAQAIASGTKPTQLNNPVPLVDQEAAANASVESYKPPRQKAAKREPAALPDLSQFAVNQAAPEQQTEQQPLTETTPSNLPDLSAFKEQQQAQLGTEESDTKSEHQMFGLFGAKFRVKDGVPQTYNDEKKDWEAPSIAQKMMAQILVGTMANAPSTAIQVGTDVALAGKVSPFTAAAAGGATGSIAAALNEPVYEGIKGLAPDYIKGLEAIAGNKGEPMGQEETAKLNAAMLGFGAIAKNVLYGPAKTVLFNKFVGEQADSLKGALINIGQKIGISPEDLSKYAETTASQAAQQEKKAYGEGSNLFDKLIESKANKISGVSSSIDQSLQKKVYPVDSLYQEIKDQLKNVSPKADLLLDQDGHIDFDKLQTYVKGISSDTNTSKDFLKTIVDIHNEANLGDILKGVPEAERKGGFTYAEARKLRQSIQQAAAKSGDGNIRSLARSLVNYESDIIKDGLEQSGKSDLADQLAIAKKDFHANYDELSKISDAIKKGVQSGNLGSAVWKLSPEQIHFAMNSMSDNVENMKTLRMSVLSNTLAHESLNNPNTQINSQYVYNTFFKNPTVAQKTKALFGNEMFDSLKAITQKAQLLESNAVQPEAQENVVNGLVKDVVRGGLSGKSAMQFLGSVLSKNQKAQDEVIERLTRLGKLAGESAAPSQPTLGSVGAEMVGQAGQAIGEATKYGSSTKPLFGALATSMQPPPEQVSSQK